MTKELSKYEQLSLERKESIKSGDSPEWATTPSYQMVTGSYFTEEDNTYKKTYSRIAKVCASHLPERLDRKKWEKIFFDLVWSGDLALSTPVLANLGTDKGMPVSCCGNYCEDSVWGFYEATQESAVLSQEGFGTATYLGDIRPRGSKISSGGSASGVMPVIKQFVQMARDINQGTRRGAWAGYLEITHEDFWEVVNYLEHNPQDMNIGWIIPDDFIEKLKNNDEDALNRYKRALKVKLVTGKGYFAFIDRANRDAPLPMREQGLIIKASQLCNEIFLFSDQDHTYTCILASMNLARRAVWSDDAIFNSTVFLDCVASEFLARARGVKGLEKAVRYTEKARSLGLGALGFHTLLQQERFAFESIDANYLNTEIFQELDEESKRASQWMAKELGEPEWCKGYGVRNLNLTAIAPNTSSAVIAGSVSPGIEPMYANAFVQPLAGGEINRVNPVLINVMKDKGVYNQQTIDDILYNDGSVQHVSWLDEEEKKVFKTAFEIDQRAITRMASSRQRYLDQGQSLNLFFPNGTSEELISEIHKEVFLDDRILGLYYIRSNSKNKPSDGGCTSCAS